VVSRFDPVSAEGHPSGYPDASPSSDALAGDADIEPVAPRGNDDPGASSDNGGQLHEWIPAEPPQRRRGSSAGPGHSGSKEKCADGTGRNRRVGSPVASSPPRRRPRLSEILSSRHMPQFGLGQSPGRFRTSLPGLSPSLRSAYQSPRPQRETPFPAGAFTPATWRAAGTPHSHPSRRDDAACRLRQDSSRP